MARLFLAALAALVPILGAAGAPQVVTDILPVQALAARVMEGVGEPALLVRPGASPHEYALKPSEAAALEKAQVVFFVGPELTPWLMRPVETLAPKAVHVRLLGAAGTQTLTNREGATFDLPDEDHDHQHGGGDDHGDHGGDHGGDHHGHHHEPGGIDPHAWLDPENGKAWTRAIAAELTRIDPANAARYGANADAAVAEIDAAEADTAAALRPLGDVRFLAFHDAFQYLEHRFAIGAAGSVSASDAAPPGPRRIATLRDAMDARQVSCVLAEPQFDPDLLGAALGGHKIPTVVIDPLGGDVPAGPGRYPAMIRAMGKALQDCGRTGH